VLWFAPNAEAGATWAGPLAVLIAGLGGAVQPLADVGLGGIPPRSQRI
jgi:hypothetical protein